MSPYYYILIIVPSDTLRIYDFFFFFFKERCILKQKYYETIIRETWNEYKQKKKKKEIQNNIFFFFIFFIYTSKYIDSVALSVVHLSPLGSQMSFAQVAANRIENVADWETIAKKYRSLFGVDPEDTGSIKDSEGENASNISETGPAGHHGAASGHAVVGGGQQQVGNNVTNAIGNQV